MICSTNCLVASEIKAILYSLWFVNIMNIIQARLIKKNKIKYDKNIVAHFRLFLDRYSKGFLGTMEWNGGMECDSYFHSIHLFGMMEWMGEWMKMQRKSKEIDIPFQPHSIPSYQASIQLKFII